MSVEEDIREVLGEIGLREIGVQRDETDGSGRQFRVAGTVPLEDGQISRSVQVEKLTWLSLPGGRSLRIRRLEVVDRTDEELRLGLYLSARTAAGAT